MKKKIKLNSVFSSGSWVTEVNKKELETDTEKYKIHINNLVLPALIGIHPHEKNKKQKISINIILSAPDNTKNSDDNIENVVSYEHIVQNIKNLLDKGHIGLLESLAEKISLICLDDNRVIDVKIKIEKLEVFKETSSVGIEIFRTKTLNDGSKRKIYELPK